jgi:tetratricopeptide (TPR) repeat protein
MAGLAITLSKQGKLEEAQRLFSERLALAARKPGQEELAAAWYDQACGAAQAGHREQAFDHLRQAVQHGYWDAEQMRSDPRFEGLVAEAKKNAAERNQKVK